MKTSASDERFVDQCLSAWEETWRATYHDYENGAIVSELADEDLIEAISKSINSATLTYRYVLPTQLIAKHVNPLLDAQCIQSQRGGEGAFDARTIAHKVIVPFDRNNHNVLGGSPEPYVNNPLRIKEISLDPEIINVQKNKSGFRLLYKVLSEVETRQDPNFTAAVLKQVQVEIIKRLSEVAIVYPTPRRISLDNTLELLSLFLAVPSGGDRPQAVATALFQIIGDHFSLYKAVNRSRTNAPDKSTGQVADLECVNDFGEVIIAVEVKDVRLVINHISDKLERVRQKGVGELFYLVKDGVEEDSRDRILEMLQKEFITGQNIYIFDLLSFSQSILALVGEQGRRGFLVAVGNVLDKYGSSLQTRRDWKRLLGSF